MWYGKFILKALGMVINLPKLFEGYKYQNEKFDTFSSFFTTCFSLNCIMWHGNFFLFERIFYFYFQQYESPTLDLSLKLSCV